MFRAQFCIYVQAGSISTPHSSWFWQYLSPSFPLTHTHTHTHTLFLSVFSNIPCSNLTTEGELFWSCHWDRVVFSFFAVHILSVGARTGHIVFTICSSREKKDDLRGPLCFQFRPKAQKSISDRTRGSRGSCVIFHSEQERLDRHW